MSAQAVFVEGHTHGRIHPDPRESANLAVTADSPGRNHLKARRIPWSTEIGEIGAGHGSFAIHVGAEKSAAERLESRHDVLWTQREGTAPAIHGDAALNGVESHDDAGAAEFGAESAKEARVRLAAPECGAPNDDLIGPKFDKLRGTANRADAAARAHTETVILGSAPDEFAEERIIGTLAHGGVKIDHMQPAVTLELFQQAKDISDG